LKCPAFFEVYIEYSNQMGKKIARNSVLYVWVKGANITYAILAYTIVYLGNLQGYDLHEIW